jgi:hypothetical protein
MFFQEIVAAISFFFVSGYGPCVVFIGLGVSYGNIISDIFLLHSSYM